MKARLCVIAVCAVILGALGAPSAADTGVIGDDDSDSYIGSGALLLARTWTGPPRDRDVLSRCLGCRWVVARSCRSDHSLCHWEQLPACPAGTVRFDVSFAPSASSALRFKGTTCIGPDGPPTKTRVHERAQQQVAARLPGLTPRLLTKVAVMGTTGAVTSGAPTAVVLHVMVLGQPVQITAWARVLWHWSDGLSMTTSTPAITRRWPKASRIQASVEATWNARYFVDDLGPFPVAQTIHQQASLAVPIRAARAVLVPLP